MNTTSWDMLSGSALTVAPLLLGAYLIRELNGQRLVGKVVETEAYDQTDAASHSYHGNTSRTKVTFGPAGHLYVHATYGMHYCCDITTGLEGYGSSVLIRAVEPIEGIEMMRWLRGDADGVHLTNGPGKFCQAFGVDKSLNGHDLREAPLQLILQPPVSPDQIVQTARIGITQAKDVLWRFYLKDSSFVSHR